MDDSAALPQLPSIDINPIQIIGIAVSLISKDCDTSAQAHHERCDYWKSYIPIYR